MGMANSEHRMNMYGRNSTPTRLRKSASPTDSPIVRPVQMSMLSSPK